MLGSMDLPSFIREDFRCTFGMNLGTHSIELQALQDVLRQSSIFEAAAT